jgi:ubiquinone/menaquinone biosynthesis C-methylase UbiE
MQLVGDLIKLLNRWQKAQRAEKIFWSEEETVRTQTAEIAEKYADLFSKMKTGDDWKILDVGCGPTILSKMIKKGEKYGVDPLADSFQGTVKRREDVEPFHFLKAVGEFLPYKDDCFDLIICRNVLNHVLDPDRVVAEVGRVCRSKGMILLAADIYSPLIAKIKRTVERIRVPFLNEQHHTCFFTHDELIASVSKHARVKKKLAFPRRMSSVRKLIKAYNRKKKKSHGAKSNQLQFKIILPFLIYDFFWKAIALLNKMKSSHYSVELLTVAVND